MIRFSSITRNAPALLVMLISAALSAFIVSCSDDDGPVQPLYEFADLETQTLALVNQHRASKSLGQLTQNAVIAEQARNHSINMAGKSVKFGHDGFDDRVTVIKNTIPLASAGENVAMLSGLSDPAQSALNGWLNSAGHRANIEGDYNLTGMGIAKSAEGALYFTQIFVKSR